MANSTNLITPGPDTAKSPAAAARESTEGIVVAFVLAFIFRAFIVEAFVIPTGSMAPTLYGQQYTHTCSTCGSEYARGVELAGGRTGDLTLQCSNCASTTDKIPGPELVKPSSGDRILVHKGPFSLGGPLGPQRWGVTVFKNPQNGTDNYIKRLVGLPGEFLEIIHGDVYAASLEEIRKSKDADVIAMADQLRRDVYRYGRPNRPGESPQLPFADIRERYRAINARLIPYLRIQRKAITAPEAQKSLWVNVYHHDYLPNYDFSTVRPEARVGFSALLLSVDSTAPEQLNSGRLPSDLSRALDGVEYHDGKIQLPQNPAVVVEEPDRRWRIAHPGGDLLVIGERDRLAVYDAAAASAWDTSSRQIRFKSDGDRLVSVHFGGKPIDDFYAYNHQNMLRVPVGDLRLAFTWFPDSGNGGLVLEMNRDKETFFARIQMDGSVQIDRLTDGANKINTLGKAKLEPFRRGKAVGIEFSNVDFRVSLKVNDREEVFSHDSEYAPNIAELLHRNPEDVTATKPSRVKIGGYRMQCRIEHLELDRDEYYRSSMISERVSSPQPDQPASNSPPVTNPYYEWPGWATQGWPIMLRQSPKEYFMLGDNSPGSKDSRLWWEIGPHLQHLGEQYQVGTVPDDQLIGQAFFVYWPSGYRRSLTGDIGIVPNFGRMRWIR